jgi:adenylate kinase family enzyme
MLIAVLGNSGSGKSSLALAISEVTGSSVLDLDTVAWEPQRGAVLRPIEDAQESVRDFCRCSDNWIVEGCYASLVSAALEFQPKLIFLNPGLEACLANCKARPWEPHKFPSPPEQEANLLPLLAWVAEYYTREGDLSLRGHLDCFAMYAGAKLELRSVPSLAPVDSKLLEWLRRGQ